MRIICLEEKGLFGMCSVCCCLVQFFYTQCLTIYLFKSSLSSMLAMCRGLLFCFLLLIAVLFVC